MKDPNTESSVWNLKFLNYKLRQIRFEVISLTMLEANS